MTTFPIAAITDEFSLDLDTALDAMAKIGMTGAELRLIGDRNMIDLSDAEVADVRRRVEGRGMRVLSIASPVLKCVLPDAPPVDERLEQDVFGSAYTIGDQPRLSKRAFEIAEMTGARIIRVFSYWRTTDPERCVDQIVAALKSQLANFKIPKLCFVVDELPRNNMGKVQKNLLREQHKQLFM